MSQRDIHKDFRSRTKLKANVQIRRTVADAHVRHLESEESMDTVLPPSLPTAPWVRRRYRDVLNDAGLLHCVATLAADDGHPVHLPATFTFGEAPDPAGGAA